MILFNDFTRQWADIGSQMMEVLEEVGSSGWYVLGKNVSAFESALAACWGTADAVGVASGLDAIEISLRVLGCKAGDKVLTSPVSAFATTLAIVKIGAIPVFTDCDSFGLIDLLACRRVLTAHPEIQYFVPVHLYGHSLDMSELSKIRDEFSLRIVEDCAQSIGASYSGRLTGTVGQVAATSFYPTKNLGALGDGGAILVNDPDLAHVIRRLRDYGQSAKYRHEDVGYNSRLDELQAAFLGRVLLPKLPEWTARRRKIACSYMEGIRNSELRILGLPAGSDSCWHLFPLLSAAKRKSSFITHMRKMGIATAEHYPTAIFDQPVMNRTRHEMTGNCDGARQFCGQQVSLPIHPYLSDEEVKYIVDACNSWPE
jgi:dTDP-3-amino-3,4,6-trideoxy-alpha-D-glucose transaminase